MSRYAAVYRTDMVRIDGTNVSGLAYPQRGPLCCALELVSGGRIVGAFRANQFSSAAAVKGLRDGWCAFNFNLRPADFIFSDVLRLRCLSTQAAVLDVEHSSMNWRQIATPGALRRRIALETLLEGQSHGEDSEARTYYALIERTTELFDNWHFIEFLYRLLLGREPDAEALASYRPMLHSRSGRSRIFDIIASSEEFNSKNHGRFPSPYDENFPALPVFAPTV